MSPNRNLSEPHLKAPPRPARVLLALGGLLFLAACTPAVEGTPATPLRAPIGAQVRASGQVVPAREATLSMAAGGVIAQVLVDPGDAVTAGQVLVQLEGRAQQAARVSAAEWARAQAQFALDQLSEETDLRAAEALRAAEVAAQARTDLDHTAPAEAAALQAVAAAARAVDTTARALTTLTKTPSADARAQAYAQLLLAEQKLAHTEEEVAKMERRLQKYQGTPLAKHFRQALQGLAIQRTQAQLALQRAETKSEDLQTPPAATDVAVAETAYHAAQARLHQAEIERARVLAGPEMGAVAVWDAQIAAGYRDYAIYQAGPDPEEVALATARLAYAEAQVAAAQETLADLELVAPFAGVITEVYVNPSEWLAPGSPVLLLADLGQLQVETTDLGELEVAQLQLGAEATLTFEALPELHLTGTIIRIAPKAAAGTGVNYPVTLALRESSPALRWGMTALVDIDLE